MGYWTEDPIERLENKKDELVEIMTTIERQAEFVAWLQDKSMYNPMESSETMLKMHRVWEAAQPPSDSVVMPKKLTAENGAKALMMGEFAQHIPVFCPDCTDEVDKEDCLTCEGEGELMQQVNISWTNIKDIYAMAVKHFNP